METLKNPCPVVDAAEQGENKRNDASSVAQKKGGCEFSSDSYISIRNAFAGPKLELNFVLPGLLSGTVGSMVGAGGSGKSFLAMELAIAVASGRDITEAFPVSGTGKVVYLNAEDPEVVITNRLHYLGAFLDADSRDKTSENLAMLSLVGRGITLMDANAMRTGWVQPVQRLAEGCRLLIFDTARRLHAANENDSAVMAQFLGIFEGIAYKTGSTILFCHHTAKFAAVNGNGDHQAASRGSSALVDNARWQVNVVGMTEKEAKERGVEEKDRRKYIRVANSKINYSEQFEDVWLEKVEGGVLRKACFSSTRRSL